MKKLIRNIIWWSGIQHIQGVRGEAGPIGMRGKDGKDCQCKKGK